MTLRDALRNRLRTAGARRRRGRVALAVAGALIGIRADAATLTRGPYLQLIGPTGVTVVWNTDVSAGCGLAIRPLGGVASTITGGTGSVCAVPVSGLQPGTAYAYVPQADGTDLGEESVFHTDDPNGRFTFLVIGDSGGAGPPQYAVAARMLDGPADFALHTGDMIYDVGAAPDFNPEFFVPYAPLLRRLVFWPCAGNHDVATAAGAPWRDAFYTPANNAAGTENYYSFDYGNAHVVVLDSNTITSPGSAQYTFLDQDLAANTKPWTFVSFHHTIYSGGAHGGNLPIRANLTPLFDAHHVDIVFMGHDHDYERTLPLRANQVVAPGQGTVYVTSGGGGRSLTPVTASAVTAHAESTYGFTRVSVDGGGLLLQMIRASGAIGDTMTLVKGTPPAPPRCGDDLVNQPGEVCDGLDHTACPAGCQADCTCVPACGDGQVNQASETCDGTADAACPELCRADCQCGTATEFVTLSPVADTYIEAGTEATWDHGAGALFDVDEKPIGIAYLKFDLSAVPVTIERATLILSCTNASPDGGTVYAVGSSTWIEGNRTGADKTSAAGTGLKWNDVDTNRDGAVDAGDTSPYVPDFTHWFGSFGAAVIGKTVSADVTGALQGGPGLYTLAIRSESSDGATYASRQNTNAALRPRLRLQLGGGFTPTTSSTTTSSTTTTSASTAPSSTAPQPSTTATTETSSSSTLLESTTTSTSASTTITSSSTSTSIPLPPGGVNRYQADVSGPAGSANVDTNVRLGTPTTTYGSDPSLYVGVANGATKVYRTLMAFNLSDVPPDAIVTACALTVTVTQRTKPTPGHVRRLCGEHWLDGDGQSEARATWSAWQTGGAWGAAGAGSTAACSAGGDYATADEVAFTPPAGPGPFTFPDLSALCQDALAQRGGWLRLRISQDVESTPSNLLKLDSSDGSTPSTRPKLTVTWSAHP